MRGFKTGEKNVKYKHGLTNTTEYRRWKRLKAKCFNKNFPHYEWYGARGITMYEPWINDPISYINYVSSLENYGVKGYTLDRINNDGNYEPGNLRWTTMTVQIHNRRKYKHKRNTIRYGKK